MKNCRYAQTELTHGSNVRGLATTAVFTRNLFPEGAKPGIPTLSYSKVETESVQMKILVRILKTEDL